MHYFINVLCFLIFFSVYTQEKIGTIILKDGTVQEGLVTLKNRKNKKVIFRKNINQDSQVYDHTSLKQVSWYDYETDQDVTYQYKNLYKSRKVLLLRKIISGKLEYYLNLEYHQSPNYGTIKDIEYFIARKDQNTVRYIPNGSKSRKFKKITDEYFKNCETFNAKMKNGFFGEDLESVKIMVAFYNENCE